MAAHVDEEVDIEHDNGTDTNETARTENDNGMALQVKGISLMLTPDLIPRNNYSQVSSSLRYILFTALKARNLQHAFVIALLLNVQYEGKNENVDVDGLDERAAEAHVDTV